MPEGVVNSVGAWPDWLAGIAAERDKLLALPDEAAADGAGDCCPHETKSKSAAFAKKNFIDEFGFTSSAARTNPILYC
jgi:hypothetical protein